MQLHEAILEVSPYQQNH